MRMDWKMLGPIARIPGDSQGMQQRTMSRCTNQCARAFYEEDATPADLSYVFPGGDSRADLAGQIPPFVPEMVCPHRLERYLRTGFGLAIPLGSSTSAFSPMRSLTSG
jgi:hypothetical protein